jgi:hypothetical protein
MLLSCFLPWGSNLPVQGAPCAGGSFLSGNRLVLVVGAFCYRASAEPTQEQLRRNLETTDRSLRP